jgi:hypothetical protein
VDGQAAVDQFGGEDPTEVVGCEPGRAEADEQPVAAWVFGVGEKKVAPLTEIAQRTTFDPAVTALGALVADRSAGQA